MISFRFKFAQLWYGLFLLAATVNAQTVAVISPDASEPGAEFAEKLSERLNGRFRVLDGDLALSAYYSSPPAAPFNMTVDEAARIGTVIGADAVIFVRAGATRRSSSQRPEYYETYAVVHAFGARSGGLLYSEVYSAEAAGPAASRKLFDERLAALASRIETGVKAGIKSEISSASPPPFANAEAEAENMKEFRPPVPYRRIKPAYTDLASLYDIRATVDVMIYLDETGEIVRADVTRWAGFGLDEAVIRNIRSMNWRPAYAGGKPLATKFLVRYNFKKGE